MSLQAPLEFAADEIIDTVREPLLLLDADLRVLKVNRSFCRVFVTTVKAAVGRPLSELGDGQWNSTGLLDSLRRILSEGSSFEDIAVEHEFPRIGRKVMVLNARLLRRRDGEAPLILLAMEDETERRAAELLLQTQAQDLARSNQDLEEFAYVASHDLQEPLRMVVSYTQLLAKRYKGKLDSDADDFIGFAVDGAKRMQRLINDLLAYSRLDRPKGPIQPADAGAALKESLVSLDAALREHGGTVEASELPCVLADHGQLIQLFQNLVGNALKFKSARPPLIRVSAERDGAVVRFRVEDNGIGIDPQYFEKVFIIFERLHGVETPGTGIGLAFCRKIIQRHGGRIWIEPGQDGGTALLFTLPAPSGDSK